MEQSELKELQERHREWILKGLESGKIFPYPRALFNRLRPYSYGGLPVSILLHINRMNNGYCYERALLMQLALEKCRVVHADIESLRLSYGDEEAEHAFVESDDFDDDKTYVIDTSLGLVIEKPYFYAHEKPKINRVFSKRECMKSTFVKEVIASDFEKDKWSLLVSLPLIEEAVESDMYCEVLKEEIAKLKQAIDYDSMVRQAEADLREIWKDTPAFERSLKIERDSYGRVISRGGVRDPYYVETKPGDWVSLTDMPSSSDFDIELDPKRVQQFIKIHKKEERVIDKRAAKRLRKIKKNPTQDVYCRE